MTFGHLVETWGQIVLISAAIIEAVAVVQRKLAAKYGFKRWPTISMVFRDDGKVWTIFPYGWGLMLGHWWGPFPRYFSWDFWIWIGCAVGIFGRDVIAHFGTPYPMSKKVIFAFALLGVATGALFWSTGS